MRKICQIICWSWSTKFNKIALYVGEPNSIWFTNQSSWTWSMIVNFNWMSMNFDWWIKLNLVHLYAIYAVHLNFVDPGSTKYWSIFLILDQNFFDTGSGKLWSTSLIIAINDVTIINCIWSIQGWKTFFNLGLFLFWFKYHLMIVLYMITSQHNHWWYYNIKKQSSDVLSMFDLCKE